MYFLPSQSKRLSQFLHLRLAHAFRHEAHAAGTHVDLRGLVEHIHLVEGCHDVGVDGKHAVFLPHHHVVAFVKGVEGGFAGDIISISMALNTIRWL